MRRIVWRAVFCSSALVGCGEATPPSAPRDLSVIESSSPLWPDGKEWTLSEAPLLMVGREDGPDELRFNQVRRVWNASDSLIVVVNGGGPPAIRVFDTSGQFVNGFGGKGEGPGEFTYVFDAWPVGGDTIIAYDLRQARATWFTRDGAIVHEDLVTRLLADGLVVRGRFDDGSWLLAANAPRYETRDEGQVVLRVLARATADASVIDTITAFEEGTQVRQGTEFELPVFLPGVGTYAAIGDRLYAGYPDAFEIDVFSAEGSPLYRIRKPEGRQQLSNDLFDRLTQARVAAAPEERRPRIRRELLEKPRPEALLAFSGRLLEDFDGNLWVQNFPLPDRQATPWSVFTQDGKYLGDVEIPSAFTPHAIDHGKVIGVWRDTLDVESIRIYELVK